MSRNELIFGIIGAILVFLAVIWAIWCMTDKFPTTSNHAYVFETNPAEKPMEKPMEKPTNPNRHITVLWSEGKIKMMEIDGHQYLVAAIHEHGGSLHGVCHITHAESCPCRLNVVNIIPSVPTTAESY